MGADAPSQGVSARGTNGVLFATRPARMAFSPTNGIFAGEFNAADVDGIFSVTDGSMLIGSFNSTTQFTVRVLEGSVLNGYFDGSHNFGIQPDLGSVIAAVAENSTNFNLSAVDGSFLGASLYSTGNSSLGQNKLYSAEGSFLGAYLEGSYGIDVQAFNSLVQTEFVSKNSVTINARNSMIVGAPPTGYSTLFLETVGLVSRYGGFHGFGTNGFTSDRSVFTKMPTNAPAVGQVLTATSTAGHTAWANSTNYGSTNYIYLTHPHQVDGTGATLGSTTTALDFGHATFSHSADQAANYVQYRFDGPPDFNASFPLYARLKFRLNAGDTGTHRYVLSCASVANSAAAAGTVGTAINLDFAGDASGASGDVESVGWTVLTGWAAALTQGQLWVIRLARDGDASQDASTQTSTEVGLVLAYVSSP